MTPKERADLDQALALMAETIPSAWRRMYDNFLKEGFTREQSYELLTKFVDMMIVQAITKHE